MTAPSGYIKVFEELFVGLELDSSKWKPTTQAMFGGYGQEIWDAACITMLNGQLELTARSDMHAGEIRSIPKFSYGYYECRAQLPKSQGFWPAFWLLSSIGTYQEIDIAECDSDKPNRIGQNLHWGGALTHPSDNGGYVDPIVNYQEGMHTFGCLYLPQRIDFYVDEIVRRSWIQPNPLVITDPMEIRLSLSIYGPEQLYAMPPGPSTVWPGKMLVDWVRFWQAEVVLPADTIPPTVSIISPVDGAKVARKSVVSVTAVAADGVGVVKVDFYVNDVLKLADVSAPYTFQFNTGGKPNAQYKIEAIATDAAGNSSGTIIAVKAQ